ncbi:Ascorbate ferrireductase (transmembrane) protein [Dioscorea alata]|uniref:Ascorbate ferrireductase (Transmembrane) protein n=1 Tax=Dioscorea alata TaxID=55571 RepID=A0ACB7WR12_DIOAL|nr:Ascorbate ferrireductase (transmembrane) protein [Dioscorea alata]
MYGGEANKDFPKALNQGIKANEAKKSERETKTATMTKLSGVRALPFTYVAHVLEVVAAVLVLVWNIYFRGGLAWDSTNKSLIFNLHPVVMVIGFLILGSEAIMSYKGLPFNKEVNKKIHLTLHLIALVLGIWGISAAFKFHNESGIDNLYSLHSWVGLGTICLYGIQWIFGFVTYFYPGGSQALRREALPWHALFRAVRVHTGTSCCSIRLSGEAHLP